MSNRITKTKLGGLVGLKAMVIHVTLLQNNGNLVIFSGSNVIWSSRSTRGLNNYCLVIQTDGNVVIYGGTTWATNTAQKSKTKINADVLA